MMPDGWKLIIYKPDFIVRLASNGGRIVTIMASVSMKPFSKRAGEKRMEENS